VVIRAAFMRFACSAVPNADRAWWGVRARSEHGGAPRPHPA
jgi:hypothetical protein